MEVKCTTCGYSNKNTTICVRCRAELELPKCSGNCSSCLLSKSENKDKTNTTCSY